MLFVLAATLVFPLSAQTTTNPGRAEAVSAHSIEILSNGIRARSNGVTLEVTALRDDVLRIREAHSPELPEDASWAVLPSARRSSVPITPSK